MFHGLSPPGTEPLLSRPEPVAGRICSTGTGQMIQLLARRSALPLRHPPQMNRGSELRRRLRRVLGDIDVMCLKRQHLEVGHICEMAQKFNLLRMFGCSGDLRECCSIQ